MKIAIIGLGVIGRVHAEALSVLGTPASVLCDLDAAKAESARDTYAPNAKIYTDWEQMLREEKPDAVHVCTPHDLHAPMTVSALRQNIHVLCEKPLCIRREEIDAVLQAERESRATLGVCHQNRYNTINRFVKDFLSDQEVAGAHGSVVWKRTAEYYASAEWRGTQDREGGGVLINQALHTFDLLMWLFGEPESVAAVKDNLTLRSEIEVEDTVAIRCFGKTDYSLFATVGSAVNLPVELNVRLTNKDHLLVLPKTVLLNGRVIAEEEIRPLGKECYGDGHIRLIQDYYHCISNGLPFPINGIEAAKVIRMILGAYQSKGERIPL